MWQLLKPLRLSRRAWLAGWLLALSVGGPVLAGPNTGTGPTGRFSRAVVEVGQPLDYVLSYAHDPAEEVVFPDSLAPFGTFEYAGRHWLPTRTTSGRSLDQAVYHLRTFSLAPVQSLQLPVLLLRGTADTLRLLPAVAQVRLHRLAPTLYTTDAAGPPTLRTTYQVLPLAPAFNYPFWLAGLAGGLALAGGAWALYGRRWRQRYGRYKRRKNHLYFLAQFARNAERFTLSRSAAVVERTVVLWKNYLSSLEDTNLNSLTTKELTEYFHNDEDVRRALRATDRVVYGNLLSEDAQEVDAAFQRLRDFAERQYERIFTA
ncbi:hypothetical protein GKZ68_04520 [Hymenobacter sp. BRD128]|uniref:hypothetical protein n=1 Tax=Hymenobacter sp. BRD128 TaxID=2675878 RepID=UPI0015656D60|nr:hypothetical protein [Hymenobacter sp. BRD128]QKG55966.1 hypothetical protein GKZ68_04520 [Hymenobacter sp. BRD128]